MFKIYTVLPVGFTSNSYLLTADNQTAVAIDPSGAHVLHFAKEHNLRACWIANKGEIYITVGENCRETQK